MKVKRYSKLKMIGLYALCLLVNIMPLIIVLIVNWNVCTKTTREAVAISSTGIVWVFFLVVTLLGATPRKINRAVGLCLVFGLFELMKPLLNYMCIFAGAAAIGAILDGLIVRPWIKRYTELRTATKSADLTTQQVKQAVKEILEEGSGRV